MPLVLDLAYQRFRRSAERRNCLALRRAVAPRLAPCFSPRVPKYASAKRRGNSRHHSPSRLLTTPTRNISLYPRLVQTFSLACYANLDDFALSRLLERIPLGFVPSLMILLHFDLERISGFRFGLISHHRAGLRVQRIASQAHIVLLFTLLQIGSGHMSGAMGAWSF